MVGYHPINTAGRVSGVVSVLAYVVLALIPIIIFFMANHAIYEVVLLLRTGAVIHSVADEQDFR
jgi:NADH:ubiquinone oxidoreductase subunit 5 (subunit L)/multisubunit Na+/H+ antiporter MnhA subunit